MKFLNGYRTIGLIILSAILSILSRKGLINPDSGVTASTIWDMVATNWEAVAALVTAAVSIWTKLRAPKPGPLAP
jgi:hypothetical protein